ncbi:uridine phosphorylase [Plesiocystis pacifica SIR-1]|uniref:Uridine phosphorylase n=1 Tax=Plesiocystis pacifica SIR-1 TaxID=391625 RepID=A6G946_9BACT|nr:nucleoside phosphorylase [Plesiocystis pacifica]EDM77594.1 uridine phosphorylase [Plesiocystis pacifica SIR-1]
MSGRSANDPQGADERQYHIGLRPGDVAPAILLVGDPKRAKRVAEGFFDDYGDPITEREFVTYTGTYRGMPMSVMGTGMSAANTEIAVIELCQLFEDASSVAIIRAGSCGALQANIGLGDLVITQAAHRLEETSLAFVTPGYPAVAHPEVVLALAWACEDTGAAHHLGITATAAGFYGAQGRNIPGFPSRVPAIEAELQRMGISNLEMEASTLLTLSTLRGFRAGAVCAVYANRVDNTFIADADKSAAEKRCIQAGLEGLLKLSSLAHARGDRPCWHPGLGLV